MRYRSDRTLRFLSVLWAFVVLCLFFIASNTSAQSFIEIEQPQLFSQSVKIGDLTANDSSALLEMVSTTQGFLASRMDNTARDLIGSPATGLLIFSTTDNEYQFFDGATFVSIGGGAGGDSWGDVVDADIVPDGDNTRDVGLVGTRFAEMHAAIFSANAGVDPGVAMKRNATAPSGQTGAGLEAQGLSDLIIVTTNNGSGITGDLVFETGNALAGAFDSGDLIFRPGTSSGGARGVLRFIDISVGTAGDCWISTNTSGAGNWDQCPTTGVTGTGTNNRMMRWDGTTAAQDTSISIADATSLMQHEDPGVDFTLRTVNTTGAQDSGDVILDTGNADSGDAGHIRIDPGPSVSGAPGRIITDRIFMQSNGATSAPSYSWENGQTSGMFLGASQIILVHNGTIAFRTTGADTTIAGNVLANLDIIDGGTGDFTVFTPDKTGATSSNRIIFKSGDVETGGSGDVVITSGTVTDGISGDVILRPGVESGTGTEGIVFVKAQKVRQESKDATNDYEVVLFDTVITTDATVTTAATVVLTPGTDEITYIEFTCVGRDVGNTDGAAYKIIGAFAKFSNVTTQIGATDAAFTAEDQAAWLCTLDVNSPDIRVRVTGEAGKTIDWTVKATVYGNIN